MNYYEYLKKKKLHGKNPPAPITWKWVQDVTGRFLYDADGVKIVVGVRMNG